MSKHVVLCPASQTSGKAKRKGKTCFKKKRKKEKKEKGKKRKQEATPSDATPRLVLFHPIP
jgi:hypothetical protein